MSLPIVAARSVIVRLALIRPRMEAGSAIALFVIEIESVEEREEKIHVDREWMGGPLAMGVQAALPHESRGAQPLCGVDLAHLS